MRKFLRNLHPTLGLGAAALFCAATSLAQAQTPPLVFNVENTGASFPAPTFPDFAHSPINRQFPDPFVFANGTRDTSAAALEQHRNEWKAAIEQYEIGPKPDCHDCTVTATYAPTAGMPTKGTLTINVVRNGKTLTFTSAIVMPTPSATCVQPAGGWPYVMGMGGATGSWPASAFNASTASPNGVTVKPTGCAATVVYTLGSIGAYNPSGGVHVNDPFYKLYPEYCAGTCNASNGYPNGSNSGEYAAWSWGVSRLIDGIQIAAVATTNPLPLDTTHSAVTGCSYAGKMAMFAGVFDERIALSIPQENGGGGAPSWRVSHEVQVQGSVEQINDTSYEWFGSQMHKYDSEGVYKMPSDHFELMAMMAPRAMIETGDSDYYWLGDLSATFDANATRAIYANYGIADRFAYYNDTVHSHCAVPAYQQNATQPFINRFLFGSNVDTNMTMSEQFTDALLPGAQPTWDPNMFTAWWGTGTPAFPPADVWNSGGDVQLSSNPNLTINTGDTIATTYALAMPGTHGAATVTVPTAYTEVDVACTDGTSYTFAVPNRNSSGYETNNQVYTIPANNNTTFPSAAFTAVNPGCSNNAPGHVTAAWFYALGKSNPGAGNPGLAGISTTEGLQIAGVAAPMNVTFNLADTTTAATSPWASWTTINRLNPYSCVPPGCPLTPTISWSPSGIISGNALGAAQLNAAATSTLLSGLSTTGTTGKLVTAPVAGTWSYSPAAGTVLSPGLHTLTATFTPTATITAATTAANAYKTYTISTASVPVLVGNVTITTTGVISGDSASGYSLLVTVKNTGTVPAPNVQLTSATLGSAGGASIPASLGTIPNGGSASVTLTFASSAGADGAAVVEKLAGTYTGGTFTGSFRAQLP